ncbi:MAG: DNA-invertase hin [Wolbachia endosymbiont of Ctenocephalides orientis wCori]|nr:MAG: DNA-invertase hin [Wolbachia endosymbiont of Ctenocephalides orientis wCori]
MSEEVGCAIYTRTSTEDGLSQEFNSLHAQRLACENYISNKQGWVGLPKKYDDGDRSGSNLNREKIQELFKDIEAGKIDHVVVYKFDRLTRETCDSAQVASFFKKHNVKLVAVTQPFDLDTLMGRFIQTIFAGQAQLEREMIIERVRDKIALSKQKGMWMGGNPPLGYDAKDKKLIINEEEAKLIRHIFERFIVLKSMANLARELNNQGYRTKRFQAKSGKTYGETIFTKATVRGIITNSIYVGKIRHHDKEYKG